MRREPRYFLVGTTAVGKSEVGVELALLLQGEIISMDSMQVYKRMDIGTAKLPLSARKGVPHHLLDFLEPHEEFSVADFKRHAEYCCMEIRERKHAPLFVGGTHLYLKVMTYGLFAGASMNPKLREHLNQRAKNEGNEVLHRELMQIDPLAANRIHHNDRKRIVRALEVYQLTGSPISKLQQEWSANTQTNDSCIVGLRMEKAELHRRIELRVQRMFEQGFVQEVENIVQTTGFGPQSSKALGYREILEYLQGKFSLEECKAQVIKKTRTFARRQMTWLRSFANIHWVDVEGAEGAKDVAQAIQHYFQAE